MQLEKFIHISPLQRGRFRLIYFSFIEKIYNICLAKTHECWVSGAEKKIYIIRKNLKKKITPPALKIAISFWGKRRYSYITLGKKALTLLGYDAEIEKIDVKKNGKIIEIKLKGGVENE